MSMQPDDPGLRYQIQQVAFADDLSSMMVRFRDPAQLGPPIDESTEWVIDLGDRDLRLLAVNVFDELCDLIDATYQERRRRNGGD